MYNDDLMNIISEILRNETSEETLKYKNLILKRLAEETEVKPTRIPAPLNITELGGYYNLIESIQSNLPDPSEFDDSERYREYVKALRLWLEDQKSQLQLSIIQSALGLPK